MSRNLFGRFGIWALGFALCLAIASASCAKAQAEGAPAGPPLQVPEPPPRVLLPVEEPPLATLPPPAAPETPPPAAATPPPAPRPAPKPQPPVAAQPAPPAPAPPTETRELRPGSPQTTAVTERSVRDLLMRAQRDLGRVDYAKLTTDGRAQYDQSKRFSAQADQALKERNLTFASTLADKAAQLAAELVGR